MAYDQWLHPDPLTGTGNGTITNTADQHTGRLTRTTLVTVNPSVGIAKSYSVNQQAYPEFVNSNASVNVPSTSTNISLTGTSNSPKLTWATKTPGTLSATVPASYNIDASTINNGVNIPGDIGAANEFTFSGVISFSANSGVTPRTSVVSITGSSSTYFKDITITQAAGPATLTVTPTTISNIPYSGREDQLTITSNTQWSVTPAVSWIQSSASLGSFNDTIQITTSPFDGRLNRNSNVSLQTTIGGSVTRTVSLTQLGRPEFVNYNSSTYVALKTGGTVTITGVSNSTKLTFSIKSGGTITPTLPATYTANGVSVANGAVIAGDPGATDEYNFSAIITIPQNLDITTKSVVIIVTPNIGTPKEATINQPGGDSVLDVTPSVVTLTAAGGATSAGSNIVNIVSNIDWGLS